VTPLSVMQELAEHPDAPHAVNMLLDLAVLCIRGRFDMTPDVYRHAYSDSYEVNAKHAVDDTLAGEASPLPQGVPMGDPAEIETGPDVVTVFGWFSPTRPGSPSPDTLHAPEPRGVMRISKDYLISEVRLDDAGSGGATCDHRGRLVAVNSFTLPGEQSTACLRMVSRLRPEHGLNLSHMDMP
jgi:hypothetical protein